MSSNLITIDSLLNNKVKIMQFKKGYRTAIDPIFLAAAVPARPGEKVLDIGCGTGAAALCLAKRANKVEITGLELQQELINLAEKSANLNDQNERTRFVQGDLLNPPSFIRKIKFNHIMANPPFLPRGTVIPSNNLQKARSNIEGDAKLSDWLDFAGKRVCEGGTVTFIHRYDRKDEVITGLSRSVGSIVVFPLWSDLKHTKSKRVIIQGIKGLSGTVQFSKGMVLHRTVKDYTKAAQKILEGGKQLEILHSVQG